MPKQVDCEERPGQELQHARHDPPWPGTEKRRPPASSRSTTTVGKESKEIDLFADLHDEGESHRCSCPELDERAATRGATLPRKVAPLREGRGIAKADGGDRDDIHRDEQRLRPDLEAADGRDPEDHQRNDRQGRDEVADRQRDAESKLQCHRHDDRLDGEEDEGERCVDERGDRRTDIPEAGTARQQVDVHTVSRGVVADGKGSRENDCTNDEDGSNGMFEAVAERDRAADRL